MGTKMTLNNHFFLLQNKFTLQVIPETLTTHKFNCYAAGANRLGLSIIDIKKQGWRVIKVVIDHF